MKKIESLSRKLPSKSERHKLFGSVEPGPKTKPTVKEKMADLQNTQKDFLFAIDQVGISKVKYPIIVNSNSNPKTQSTIGEFTLTAKVDRMSKGTNMSRFLEQMEHSNENGFQVDFNQLTEFSHQLKERLKQENISIQVSYPWFYERKGPSSNKAGLNHANVTQKVDFLADGSVKYSATLSALITTLCPCSKEISEYSAHSQRGHVKMDVIFNELFNPKRDEWKEDLLNAAESNASAMIHPVLKRPDEKYVTESAYENPRFVEDIVRLVAADLYELPYTKEFQITCENEESIHMHNAIARIQYNKED